MQPGIDNNSFSHTSLNNADSPVEVKSVITPSNIFTVEENGVVVHEKEEPVKKSTPVESSSLSDIIGEFGFYQLSLAAITFIRYVSLAMMTNTGPLIAPSVDFWCLLPDSFDKTTLLKPNNVSQNEFLKDKCSLELRNGERYHCNEWSYDRTNYGITLTDTFNLVCDREWMRSAFQSTVSFGIVLAAVVWGSVSDKNGRQFVIKVTFFISLFSGIVSYFASSLWLYAISRAICSFSDLGLVVSLSTIIVETLGNKFRGATCVVVYTGWAFGVMVMPWLTEYFKDYRQLMVFTVMVHLLTLPWLITIGESVRWLLVNGKIEESREELRRISRWNLEGDNLSLSVIDEKFEHFKRKFVLLDERRNKQRLKNSLVDQHSDPSSFSSNARTKLKTLADTLFGGIPKAAELFQSKELLKTTVTLIWTTFNCELMYMLFIIINSDIGDNVKLNYAVGLAMEVLATLIAIVILWKVTRKFALVSIILIISCLCFIFAFTHSHPVAGIFMLNSTKLAISTLSSILYVATTEIFPTNLRQTGFGVTGTLGSLGAVVAPFFRTELSELIGLRQVLLIVALMPLTAALLIPLLLRETKDVELPDDVEDIIENEQSSSSEPNK